MMKSPDRMVYERFCGTRAKEDYESEPGGASPSAKIIMNPYGTNVTHHFLIQTGPTAALLITDLARL